MRRTKLSVLSLVLAFVMVFSMMPAGAFAAESATWTKVDPAAVTAEDTIMVTMTNPNGVTYALYTVQSGSKGPDAKVVTVSGDTITTEGTADYGWTVTPVEGGYTLSVGGAYLYTINNNNGVRIGDTQAVWAIDGNYLSSSDGTQTRWLGVYDNNNGDYSAVATPNWRAYKNTTGNTKNQVLGLYKLEGTAEVPNPTDPTEPSEPAPTEPAERIATYLAEAPQNGDTVIIYNAANTAVLSNANSGSRLAGEPAEVVSEGITLNVNMASLLVGVENDVYTFSYDGQYLTSAESGNGLSFSETLTDCGKWTLEASNDKWIIKNVGANYNGNHNQALEYYKGFTTYGVKDTEIYWMDFYLVEGAKSEGVLDELHEGDTVVIFNKANAKALSTEYDGFYNKGTDVVFADGKLTGWTESDVWTVGLGTDGTWTFATAEGKQLSMGTSYSSTPLDDVNRDWAVIPALSADCWYIKNVARNTYLEWYADKGNWSSYYDNSNEELFAHVIYRVNPDNAGSGDSKPEVGSQVVLYNLSAQGVLAAENDTQSIENALTTVENGIATPGNGGVVFTIQENGDYFRFFNETYGYLCSTGTGNNAFYSLEATDDADWLLLPGKSGGYFLESRTAKYNGKYSQYLEYYADSYKTYSMYNVTDYDIYEFFFYPVAEGVNLTGSIVNQPAVVFGPLADANVGADYTFSFQVEAVFGLESLSVAVNGTALELTEDNVYTVPAEMITGTALTITVEGVDTKGVAFSATATVNVKDEPAIGEVTPAAGTQTGDNKRPVITAALSNVGEAPTVTMTVNGTAVEAVYENGLVSYTPAADLADGRTSVTVTVIRADGKSVTKTWSFTVGENQFALYFGQLHSHTTYSDGSGTLDSALSYIEGLPESANVDFVAFTDHSNYFDSKDAVNPEGALYDMSIATADSQKLWSAYKGAVADFNARQDKVVAIAGFEMTWSGGPGHINTFNTPGIVSRNNTTLNNKTGDAGMKAYYALLSQPEGLESISQFNHPGTTFGNFSDFAYWDALIDSRVFLVEVGNGEGQVGAGGYYPSYEQYTMALDKGWHLAPTNNQDNHKGKWGNANDARDVVLTADFSEEGIYEAIRSYRVYATEDKNLEIGYTVNGKVLGSMIEEVPEKLNVEVTVYDPDTSDSISKVEVIVNSGKVAHTWENPADLATGLLTAELEPSYSYYYIRVTQGDGDTAVTAPVWVGETLKLGISSVVCGTSTPVTGEELAITTTLFNSEATEATVKSLTYTVGSQVLGVDNTGYTLSASGSTTVDFLYTPEVAKVMAITVTVVLDLDGVEYTFSMDVNLDVQDADKLVYIGIDASHYNEYVAGNYKDSMGNFGTLAAGYSVRTVDLKTSEELIAACTNAKYAALILTAPSRRLAAAQAELRTYTDDEIAAIKVFNEAGGTVILAGWSDNYENYDAVAGMTAQQHMAATQNALLEALGSSLRISDDATRDDALNGGQAQRLYFNAYNMEHFLMDGVEVDPENPNDRLYTEVYSQYGGASIHVVDETGTPTTVVPDSVTPIVYGHSSTYSADSDQDGLGGDNVPKYAYAEGDDRLMVLASETVGENGLIIVAGAAFMSNFEVQATIEDSGAEKNYSNYKICENLVSYLNPVTITDIAQVQAQTEEGIKYTIEGVVTSNASGFDKDTAFFDCIYLQDETAGINAFPVAGSFQIGDKVRITGTTSSYQGERQIAVTKIELLSQGHQVTPVEITAKELNDGSKLGSLVTLKGTVESFAAENGLIQTIMVTDAAGELGRVFIDGYITTGYDVRNLAVGAEITVTGLASYDNSFDGPAPRIRVRDRNDVVCLVAPDKFVDVDPDQWFYDSVYDLVNAGILKGTTEHTFNPEGILTRAEWVTMLYRASGSPAVTEPSTFTDVPETAFYADAFAWAEDAGIVTGMAEGVGAPLLTISREQMVTMLYRMDGQHKAAFDLSVYEDVEDVSYYAFDAFEWAVAKGYVHGMTATTLAPQATANRAQAATILARYLK